MAIVIGTHDQSLARQTFEKRVQSSSRCCLMVGGRPGLFPGFYSYSAAPTTAFHRLLKCAGYVSSVPCKIEAQPDNTPFLKFAFFFL